MLDFVSFESFWTIYIFGRYNYSIVIIVRQAILLREKRLKRKIVPLELMHSATSI